MSDLVARLRDGAISPYVAWKPVNVLRREAAAEIERLRAALESAGGFLAGWRHCRARQTRDVISAALNPHLPRPEWLEKFQAAQNREP